MLATPIKLIAARVIKPIADENISIPIINCTEKKVDKAPETISRTAKYLRIEFNISKT